MHRQRTAAVSGRSSGPARRLRVGFWHVDGGSRPAGLSNKPDSPLSTAAFECRMPFIERIPAVRDLLRNVHFDIFAVMGVGPALLDAAALMDADRHLCVATAPGGTGRGGSTFVFAANPTIARNSNGDMPEWRVEAVPGAGGAHVRATHYTGAATAQFCFVNFDSVDRTSLGTQWQTLDAKRDAEAASAGGNGSSSSRGRREDDPVVFPVDKELAIVRGAQSTAAMEQLAATLRYDTNEIRMGRYISDVVTECDVVAGHTCKFRFDTPFTAASPSSKAAPRSSSSWGDAWSLSGSPHSDEYTFEPAVLMRQYWRRIRDAPAATKAATGDDLIAADDDRGAVPNVAARPLRLDSLFVRNGRSVSVASFKTMRWPCVSRTGEKLLASCFNPVIVELKVEQQRT
jgi:hypothetical protein